MDPDEFQAHILNFLRDYHRIHLFSLCPDDIVVIFRSDYVPFLFQESFDLLPFATGDMVNPIPSGRSCTCPILHPDIIFFLHRAILRAGYYLSRTEVPQSVPFYFIFRSARRDDGRWCIFTGGGDLTRRFPEFTAGGDFIFSCIFLQGCCRSVLYVK